jgi:hypothetical protein
MANNRIYYAMYRAGIAPMGDVNLTSIQGLQTINMNTTFNLEQAFEIGQLAIYENIEGIPDVEVTCEKVLDGYCPIYLLATGGDVATTTGPGIAGRSAARADIGIEFYADTVESVGNGGSSPISTVLLSGMYPSSVGYTVPVEGNATESMTVVGNNKSWGAGGALTYTSNPFVNNADSPLAISGSGGVNRRENVKMGADGSVFPSELPGMTNYGGGSGRNILTGTEYGAHLQSISINVDFNREELFELGRRGPYFRFINYPVEVTSEFVVTSASGDMINATEDVTVGGCSSSDNLQDGAIVLKMCEGLVVDCGTANKLASVSVTGGDANGGNMEVTYSYTNFNVMAVYHPQDPLAGEAGFTYAGG